MENTEDVTDMYSSIKPLLCVSKLFGLTSFSFPKQNNYKYKVMQICLLFMWVTVLLSTTCCNVYTFLYSVSDVPEKIKVTFIFNNLSMTLTNIITLITNNCCNKSHTINIFKKIKNFDKILDRRSRNKIYKTTKLSVLRRIIVVFVLILLSYSGSYYIYYDGKLVSILQALVDNISYTLNIVVVLQYITLVRMLLHRYKFMIEKITKYSETEDSARIIYGKTHSRNSSVNIFCGNNFMASTDVRPYVNIENYGIHTLRLSYIRLYETVALINSYFGIQILLQIISLVIVCVTAFYYGLYIFCSINTDIADFTLYFKPCLLIFWTFLYATLFAWLIVCCHQTELEGHRGIICIQIITSHPNIKHGKLMNLNNLSNQLKDMKVEFTACGIFALNFSLLCTVIGGILTYILIMVQLQ